jgi:hypothetical protein
MWKQSLLLSVCFLFNHYNIVAYGQSTGYINNRIWLVKANLSSRSVRQDAGVYSNGSIVNVSSLNRDSSYLGPLGLAIPVTGDLIYINTTFQNKSYYDPGKYFYALGINNGNNYTIIPELRLNGNYSIQVDAVSTNGYVNTTYLYFSIVGGSSAQPVPAPVAPQPTAKPSADPSSKPTAQPSPKPAPVPIPVTVPIPVPAMIPIPVPLVPITQGTCTLPKVSLISFIAVSYQKTV